MSNVKNFSDTDSEKAVIGCVLLNNEVIENVIEILSPQDFFEPLYQKVFVAMQKMYERNEPLDPLSVAQRTLDLYHDSTVSEQILEEIQGNAPAPSSVEYYAQRIVREFSKREANRLLKLAQKEIGEAEDPMAKISETVSKMENIRSESVDQTIFNVDDLFRDRAQYIDDKQQGKVPSNILPTGLSDLDNLLSGGLRFQHFDVLAARPGMGKTSLATQFLLNSAIRENVSCLFFSIEMSKEEVMDKMISIESKIPYKKISDGDLDVQDWESMIDLSNKILSNPNDPKSQGKAGIFIDDITKDLNRMIAIIRRCVRKYNVRFVVIDYLQLISIAGKFGNRDEQLGHAVNMLAYTAKVLNINILSLSQLNRGVESRESKRPSLSDLRESGNIEQAAWRVLSIYRDDYYNLDSNEKGTAEISVLKGKISHTGKVQVYFDKDCTKFSNLDWKMSNA